MATSEALTKYYDCLKDSFNKIQLKNNKTALVNAALRPKIREEFAKSKDVLVSYLNYLKVFTPIYSDKFSNICISIICPLFKDHPLGQDTCANTDQGSVGPDGKKDTAHLVHDTIRIIFKSKPELIDEFIQSIIKLFPSVVIDDDGVFRAYLSNALEVCTYIRGEPLTNLVARILDRINPPSSSEPINKVKLADIKNTINASYDLIYQRIDDLESKQLENFSAAILAAFTREFLTSDNDEAINHLLLYICSKDTKLADLFMNLLWANFTDTDRSLDERRASALYASSFMSRARYISLENVLNHLETASIWCLTHLKDNLEPDNNNYIPNQAGELFHPLVESMLYLITQRYREMYEEETLIRIRSLNLNEIINSPLKPLDACNGQTVSRFYEVANLYSICSLSDNLQPRIKKRKSVNDVPNSHHQWKIPLQENCDSLPTRLKSIYRNYFDHRNFTIYRE